MSNLSIAREIQTVGHWGAAADAGLVMAEEYNRRIASQIEEMVEIKTLLIAVKLHKAMQEAA